MQTGKTYQFKTGGHKAKTTGSEAKTRSPGTTTKTNKISPRGVSSPRPEDNIPVST